MFLFVVVVVIVVVVFLHNLLLTFVYPASHSTHEDGGSSKIAVPTRDITMVQILKSVVKKRQLPLDESCELCNE